MKKFFDKQRGCLIYVNKEADEQYWDQLWKKEKQSVTYDKGPKILNNFVCKETQNYLPKGSVVLEGGCGLALNSWNLYKLGYQPIALDYAKETIAFLNESIPEVNSICGDVRNLDLDNDSIDGYWSLGVIEHFYEGYDPIIKEMTRVIKPDGYLFLTFPHMSLLRKLKGKLSFYSPWKETEENLKDFYQFALDEKKVILDLEQYGFKAIAIKNEDGFKGLKDESYLGRGILQKIYKSNSLFARIVRYGIQNFFSWFSSHIILIVLKKQKI
ncbi:class I SAM-dependent methyltransferase [bacterium]|nr:class I SAM-dependent methyltransferase [bacterium]